MRDGETWVLVASSTVGRLLTADPATGRLVWVSEEREPVRRTGWRELAGRLWRGRGPAPAVPGATAAADAAPDPDEVRGFARVLVAMLAAKAAIRRPARIVLVAPPDVLRELRDSLPERLARLVDREVDEDLAVLSQRALGARLTGTLWSAGAPRTNGRPATVRPTREAYSGP
jgi:hypothetical protein